MNAQQTRWVAVFLWIAGCSDADIIQPRNVVLEEGQDMRLECTQNNGHLRMFWFQQSKQQQDLQLLYNFYNGNIQYKNPSLHRLNADQPEQEYSHLSISDVKPEDSAVYFCASSEATAYQSTAFFLQKSPFFCVCEPLVVYKETLGFSARLSYVTISTKLKN